VIPLLEWVGKWNLKVESLFLKESRFVTAWVSEFLSRGVFHIQFLGCVSQLMVWCGKISSLIA